MPIYEYRCLACGHEFEKLVLPGSEPPHCPDCQATSLERGPSLFAVNTEAVRQSNLERAREANKKIQKEKAVADHELFHHHH